MATICLISLVGGWVDKAYVGGLSGTHHKLAEASCCYVGGFVGRCYSHPDDASRYKTHKIVGNGRQEAPLQHLRNEPIIENSKRRLPI